MSTLEPNTTRRQAVKVGRLALTLRTDRSGLHSVRDKQQDIRTVGALDVVRHETESFSGSKLFSNEPVYARQQCNDTGPPCTETEDGTEARNRDFKTRSRKKDVPWTGRDTGG